MIFSLALILILQLGGSLLADALDLPLPGPVLGMVGLLVFLRFQNKAPDGIDGVADGLIRLLPLFFVPAGVGLMLYFDRIMEDGFGIVLAMIPGTFLALGATGWLFARLAPPSEGPPP